MTIDVWNPLISMVHWIINKQRIGTNSKTSDFRCNGQIGYMALRICPSHQGFIANDAIYVRYIIKLILEIDPG